MPRVGAHIGHVGAQTLQFVADADGHQGVGVAVRVEQKARPGGKHGQGQGVVQVDAHPPRRDLRGHPGHRAAQRQVLAFNEVPQGGAQVQRGGVQHRRGDVCGLGRVAQILSDDGAAHRLAGQDDAARTEAPRGLDRGVQVAPLAQAEAVEAVGRARRAGVVAVGIQQRGDAQRPRHARDAIAVFAPRADAVGVDHPGVARAGRGRHHPGGQGPQLGRNRDGFERPAEGALGVAVVVQRQRVARLQRRVGERPAHRDHLLDAAGQPPANAGAVGDERQQRDGDEPAEQFAGHGRCRGVRRGCRAVMVARGAARWAGAGWLEPHRCPHAAGCRLPLRRQ